MDTDRISQTQLCALLWAGLLAPVAELLPGVGLEQGGRGAWLVPLLLFPVLAGTGWLLARLGQRPGGLAAGMINNTNLAQMTGPDELRDGYEVIKQVSEITGVPVKYTSGKKELLDIFLAEGHDPKYIGTPIAIDTYMQRDWDSWVRGLSD